MLYFFMTFVTNSCKSQQQVCHCEEGALPDEAIASKQKIAYPSGTMSLHSQ